MLDDVTILSGEMATGRRLVQLPASAGTVRAVLNDEGEVTCTIPLRAEGVRDRTREVLAAVEPWRTFLAFQAGERLVEAGPVVAHEYDDRTGEVAVKAVGMFGLMRHRLVINAGASQVQKSSLNYSGLSLGTIGKRIVQRSLQNPGGDLPLVLPADVAGDHVRNYPGYEFATVAQRLADLSDVEGGPEFAFEPRFTTDRLGVEWVMRAGTDTDPLLHQIGDAWVWDLTTASALAGLSVTRDGANRTNSVYVTGQGMDESIKVARAATSAEWSRGYPLLEAAYSHSTVTRQSTLDRHATAYRQQGSRPWATWRLTVMRDTYPSLAQYRCGDWVAVHVADHPYLADGVYRSRIAALTASLASPTVTLDLVPTLDRR